MASPELSATRSLGGLDALSAYRAERAATRLRLRDSLRASRAALRAARGAAAPAETDAAIADAPAAEEPSVFAELLGRQAEAPCLPEPAAAMPEDAAQPGPDAAPVAEEAPALAADPADAPPDAPPQDGAADKDLGAIAELGPGMRLRLAQIGIHTLDDLAQADAGALRAGLGEISRMLRVERWIEAARSLRRG
jgi:predicted flap endonuclease-1-like 5' DNA nuclease